jgi:hypothetical protein
MEIFGISRQTKLSSRAVGIAIAEVCANSGVACALGDVEVLQVVGEKGAGECLLIIFTHHASVRCAYPTAFLAFARFSGFSRQNAASATFVPIGVTGLAEDFPVARFALAHSGFRIAVVAFF